MIKMRDRKVYLGPPSSLSTGAKHISDTVQK